MRSTPQARRASGPLRTTALRLAGLVSGAALLLAGCSQAGQSGTASSASRPAANHAAAAPAAPVNGAGQALQPAGGTRAASGAGAAAPSAQAARLALATQSIIYTATLTVRATNVTAAASQATSLAVAQGGYVSSEHASARASDRTRPTVSLQLKIPVAVYQPTLGKLARLGTEVSLSEQATDVTQQVADVNSLVTSSQDAITQLEALLKRAGSVADLLSVQDQINQQESSLEALQAQQRALAGETSYATVSVTLLGPPARHTAKKATRSRHGFLAGLASGWRGLRVAASAVFTAIGAVLPFALVAAVLAGAGYAGRRRLRRLLVRRRTPPTPAG
ncbi:MAG TPA: DUF4349 domain-containing protein [Streptosporangiaceae bacterium]|nr:DUF4349 domain-containing protein [Streptosporangiaceae bacterium]